VEEYGMPRKDCFILVVNRTSKVFSVHGPMSDDTHITERVATAQVCGTDIRCQTPATDKSEAVSWAEGEGLSEVSDATRTEDIKGPWEVLDADGDKVGRLESNMNFDLWFAGEVKWALVKGHGVYDHGTKIGELRRAEDALVYHPASQAEK